MTNSDRKKKFQKSSEENSTIREQANLSLYLSDDRSSDRNQDLSRTLADVKHELQTMVDAMGPDTPQFPNTSSEAENDTSLYTVSTSSNTENAKKKVTDSDEPAQSQETSTAQESSSSLTSQTKNTSVLVEFPSSQSHRNDDIDDFLTTDRVNHASICHGEYPQLVSHGGSPVYQNPYNNINNEAFAQQGSHCGIHSNNFYHSGNSFRKKKGILDWFGYKQHCNINNDLYKVKIKQESPNLLPKQLTFERADDVSRHNFSPFKIKKLPRSPKHQFRQVRYFADYPALSREPTTSLRTFPTSDSQKYCNAPNTNCSGCENYYPESCGLQRGNYSYCSNGMPTYSDVSCACEDIADPSSPNTFQNPRPFEQTYSTPTNHISSRTPPAPYSPDPPYQPQSLVDHVCIHDVTSSVQRHSSSPERFPEKLSQTEKFSQNYSYPICSKEEHAIKDKERNDKKEKHKKNDTKQAKTNIISEVPEKQCGKCGKVNSSSFNSVKESKVFGHDSSSFVRSPGENYEVMHYGDRDFDQQRIAYYDTSGATRVDVYYFDHGNAGFYRTTDLSPPVASELLAEKTEAYTSRFWAELFGTVHIGFSFFTSFVLQFVRFIMYGFLRPLLVGGMQLVSDYFLKPSLSTCFNSVIQPFLIFLYNIASSIRDLCDPIAAGIGYYIREVAVFIRAFRIIDVHQTKKGGSDTCIDCNRPPTVENVRRKNNR